jgi:PKD repeat protein
MARPTRFVPIVTALVLAATWSCTTHKQDAPSLTGPSELGTSLSITVSPDVLRQDGASQSLVTVTARDNQGQPLRNLTLRAEITVAGIITDFGSLSARNVVTGTDGRATFTYTAPPAGPVSVDTGTIVSITVSPMGTDFGNATSKTVDIRLVPPGVIGAPPTSLRLAINLPNAVTGDTAVFTANVTDSSGNDASGQVASYSWGFGDGGTAVGRTASHTYTGSGNFAVSLTIVDVLGRVGQASSSLTVSAGVNPTATFVVSPSSPNVGQTVGFNASSSAATPGHSITSYSWDFGDLTVGSGQTTTHSYSAAGQYSVVLTTKDDVGRKGVATQNVSVGAAGLSADFNFSPSSPIKGQSVQFDASTSRASTGRTITRYDWNYDDGTTDSGVQPRHIFNNPGTFNVRLTVTDDLGQTANQAKAVTVGAATLSASFTFSPSSPLRGQTVNFDGSGSRAAPGRSIANYAWNFDDGATAVFVTTVHAFNNTGTFTVRLTVTDDIGQTATTTLPVTVSGAAPTPLFTFSPSAPVTGQSVQFDASTSRPAAGRTITAYQWNFDDGTTGTGIAPSHAFTTARTFAVRLTVTDDFGQTGTTSVPTVQVSLASPTTADFQFQPASPSPNQTVSFDASLSRPASGRTITNYSWNFDDGGTATGVTTSHAFALSRSYNVRLTVTDDSGLTVTASKSVAVTSVAPTARFTFLPPTPDVGQSVTFDGSQSTAASGRTITTYSWNFGDGTVGSTRVVTHAYSVANTYQVTLTVTDDAGLTNTSPVQSVPVASGSATAVFTFTPPSPQKLADAVFTFDASASRAGSNATINRYQWQFDGTPGAGLACATSNIGGPVFTTTSPTITRQYSAAGTFCVVLTVFDNNGGSNSTVRPITIQP